MSWSAASGLWIKLASFGAQVVLGYLLSDGEWGVYAIAISVSTLVMALREGGALEILLQRGETEYETLRERIFALALTSNILLAGLLASMARPIAAFYHQPDVAPLLWVMAAALLLSTPAMFLKARLRIHLRFPAFAQIGMASAVLQYGGAVVLAWQDFGPLSFVLPLPFVAVFEWLMLAVTIRESPSLRRAGFYGWRSLLPELRWLLMGSVATVTIGMGDYAVLGRLVSADVLGVYYFAFQLSAHSSTLVAANFGAILTPTLVKLGDDIARQQRAVLRSIRSLVIVVSPVCLALAVLIEPLEMVIWRGRWSQAVVPTQILCLMLPVRITFEIGASTLKARGAFRRWALLATLLGLGLLMAAWFAGRFGSGASGVALFVAAYFLLSSPLALFLSVRSLGVELRQTLWAIFPPWAIAVACSGATALLESHLGMLLSPLAKIPVLLIVFTALYAAGTRTLLGRSLADLVSVLPPRLQRMAARILIMR